MKQNVLSLIKVNAGRLFMFLLLLSFSQIVSAQTKVSGKVVDEKGEAIIGASIVVKGTTAGSITNVDGDFVLNVSSVKDILVVSYVGYKSQEVGLSGRTSIRIQLKEDSELLSEVVVVGYGSQKKVNLTGAVATVGAETFGSKGTTNTPLANLQGALAGVTVTRSSSSPTRSDWKFEIRGKSSMNDAEPLVIVDGVPGGIDNINPDDIESISILKDASAAIYGARAAGGVVLVTTKRGTAQKKTKVTYKGNVTARTPGLAMDYMNMREYMTTFEEAYINDGKAFDADLNIYPRWVVNAYKVQNVVSDPTSPLYTGAFAGMNTWAAYSSGDIHDYGFYDVDWNDELWGTAYSQSHSLQLSGGSDSNTYNLSLGYVNDNSVLQWGDDNLKRYNIRLNNDFKISKRLKLASNISYDRSTKLYPQRKPNEIGGQPAGSPIATENGLPYAWGGQMGNQWFSKLGGDVNEYSNNFMTNFNLTANIAKDLDLVASATMRTNNYNNKWWESKVQWYYLDETKNLVSPSTDKVGVKSAYSVYQNYSAYLDSLLSGKKK